MKTANINFTRDAERHLQRIALEDRIRALFFSTIGIIVFFGFAIFAFRPIW